MTKDILKIKEWLKLKKPDYEGFVYHIKAWDKEKLPYGFADLVRIAKAYNCPLPQMNMEDGQMTFNFNFKPIQGVKSIIVDFAITKTGLEWE